MNNYKELEDYIKNNKDWQDKLKPYMKTIAPVDFNAKWVVPMYCLFDIPSNKNLLKVIMQCRGSVVNKDTGEIICAPFVKFWNFGEKYAADIDWDSAKVTHKRDGWIFEMFKYNNEVYFKSNGRCVSKMSPGAPVDIIPGLPVLKDMGEVLARAWKLGSGEDLYFAKDGHLTVDSEWVKALPSNCTLCFELESPWNRIHTDLVNDAKLWFIMYRDQNGDEHDIYNVDELNIPFERPQLYNWKSEKEMLDSLKTWTAKDNGEGVVVVDKNFNRVKIKTEDYRRIKFETNSNDYGDNRLFRYFAAGEIDDLVAVNPDLLPRIEVFRAKLKELDNKLAEWKAIADSLNYVYRDKQALHLAINSKYSGWEKVFIRRLLKQTPEQVKDFLLHGKNGWCKASTPFTELCEIVGK